MDPHNFDQTKPTTSPEKTEVLPEWRTPTITRIEIKDTMNIPGSGVDVITGGEV